MTISPRYLLPQLPPGLEGLEELALDLRWSCGHAADEVWERLDPRLWALTRNPWLILQTVSTELLADLAADDGFHTSMGPRSLSRVSRSFGTDNPMLTKLPSSVTRLKSPSTIPSPVAPSKRPVPPSMM